VSVVAADGFVASGVACGIKPSGDTDLALVATADGAPAAAAGAFTQNLVVAAPVTVSRRHLAATGGRTAAVVLSSGNANAATGERGELDAEGHTKVVKVRVTGAASDDEARQAARNVAESQLVKCSWFGGDPYWGRVASDLGTAGVKLDPTGLSIAYGGTVVSRGCVGVEHDAGAVAAHMAGEYIEVHCDLAVGEGEARVLTNDLTYGYIDENRGTS
jgi:N-acetylglutamate synthase/N-acetylornithine aminotransferase